MSTGYQIIRETSIERLEARVGGTLSAGVGWYPVGGATATVFPDGTFEFYQTLAKRNGWLRRAWQRIAMTCRGKGATE